MTGALQSLIQCPACGGEGTKNQLYAYKPQGRPAVRGVDVERAETCQMCKGTGNLSQDLFTNWQNLKSLEICPACKGTGGKRYWSWQEANNGTQKTFELVLCKVCHGNQHVTVVQLQAHERERRKLQFWGLTCAALALAVGICGVSQVASLILGSTYLVQCCALPHFLVPGALVIGYQLARM